ncbi:glycosyltransferase family 4 protein [Anatilimnocola floriformis]|uniref:glycosyltransferase family 4 protein n=1 Tax=Anatilimnocola floriformis TaxID=2948575 RepID=UPI0020C23987|nr:glycosyltransferase family 4 protein [Anatilimnocola floriformis]
MIAESKQDQPLRIMFIVTVPMAFHFLKGHLEHLAAQGFDIHLVSSPGEQLDQFARTAPVEVHAVPISRTISPLQDLSTLWQLWSLMREVQPDIVHSYTPKAALLGTIAARLSQIAVVAISLFGLPQMARRGVMRWLLDATTRLSCWLADWVWTDSPSLRDYVLQQRLCSPAKLNVLHHGSVNGVDTLNNFSPERFSSAELAAARRRYDIPAGSEVLGFVGRLCRDKGINELLIAWQTLREIFPDLQLLLVGPREEGLTAESMELLQTDPRIKFAGMTREVALHLSLMDVFVNPSYREGFGVANLEAGAMALPVVSTRIPGCVDSVCDGVTGTLVPTRDPAALIAAITEYLTNRNLAQQHGQAGRLRAQEDFAPSALWSALERQYRTLLAQTNRSLESSVSPSLNATSAHVGD